MPPSLGEKLQKSFLAGGGSGDCILSFTVEGSTVVVEREIPSWILQTLPHFKRQLEGHFAEGQSKVFKIDIDNFVAGVNVAHGTFVDQSLLPIFNDDAGIDKEYICDLNFTFAVLAFRDYLELPCHGILKLITGPFNESDMTIFKNHLHKCPMPIFNFFVEGKFDLFSPKSVRLITRKHDPPWTAEEPRKSVVAWASRSYKTVSFHENYRCAYDLIVSLLQENAHERAEILVKVLFCAYRLGVAYSFDSMIVGVECAGRQQSLSHNIIRPQSWRAFISREGTMHKLMRTLAHVGSPINLVDLAIFAMDIDDDFFRDSVFSDSNLTLGRRHGDVEDCNSARHFIDVLAKLETIDNITGPNPNLEDLSSTLLSDVVDHIPSAFPRRMRRDDTDSSDADSPNPNRSYDAPDPAPEQSGNPNSYSGSNRPLSSLSGSSSDSYGGSNSVWGVDMDERWHHWRVAGEGLCTNGIDKYRASRCAATICFKFRVQVHLSSILLSSVVYRKTLDLSTDELHGYRDPDLVGHILEDCLKETAECLVQCPMSVFRSLVEHDYSILSFPSANFVQHPFHSMYRCAYHLLAMLLQGDHHERAEIVAKYLLRKYYDEVSYALKTWGHGWDNFLNFRQRYVFGLRLSADRYTYLAHRGTDAVTPAITIYDVAILVLHFEDDLFGDTDRIDEGCNDARKFIDVMAKIHTISVAKDLLSWNWGDDWSDKAGLGDSVCLHGVEKYSASRYTATAYFNLRVQFHLGKILMSGMADPNDGDIARHIHPRKLELTQELYHEAATECLMQLHKRADSAQASTM